MPRLEGWETRLQQLVDAARDRAYVLGEHDCFRLACRVVQAVVGVDRWPEFAGYTSRREALALLARHGSSFEAAFDGFFGAPAVPASRTRRGDLLCVQTSDGEKHLAVCLGAPAALLAPQGLIFTPTRLARCGWQVGE